MWERIKGAGGFAFAIAALGGVVLLFALFIEGGVWLGEKIHPWLVTATGVVLGIVTFVFLPLLPIRKARAFSCVGLNFASAMFGFTLWVWGLLLTYRLWGAIAVVIGLVIFGVGVIPVAMIATLFKGMWLTLGELVLLSVLTFGTRFIAVWAARKVEED